MTGSTSRPHLGGVVEDGWEDVLEAFAVGFDEGRELGASLCVIANGRRVVDVWGGTRDSTTGDPWRQDTLVPLTSVTKSVLATVSHLLIQSGVLELDRPVADYWPEFGRYGKREITSRLLLSHRAGLPLFSRPITFADQLERTPIIDTVAAIKPLWKPGTAHGYHAITLGFMLTEVMRRATGSTERPLLRELLSQPLGLDLHLGVSPEDLTRIARMSEALSDDQADITPDPALAEYREVVRDERSLMYRATFGSVAMSATDTNDERYATMERPSGGYATARAVATMFAALIGPVEGHEPLLSTAAMERARSRAADGMDQVFRMHTSWGLGYLLPGSPLWRGAGDGAFGHIGSNGSLAYADPEQRLALTYLPNQIKSVLECTDRRAHRIMAAASRCRQRVLRR